MDTNFASFYVLGYFPYFHTIAHEQLSRKFVPLCLIIVCGLMKWLILLFTEAENL